MGFLWPGSPVMLAGSPNSWEALNPETLAVEVGIV